MAPTRTHQQPISPEPTIERPNSQTIHNHHQPSTTPHALPYALPHHAFDRTQTCGFVTRKQCDSQNGTVCWTEETPQSLLLSRQRHCCAFNVIFLFSCSLVVVQYMFFRCRDFSKQFINVVRRCCLVVSSIVQATF